jgi:hypothetical protein
MTKTTSLRLALKSDSSHLSHSVCINGIICIHANQLNVYLYHQQVSRCFWAARRAVSCAAAAPARRELTAFFTSLNWSFIHINAFTCLKCSERPSPCMEKTRLVCARQLAFLPGATNKYLPFSFSSICGVRACK